jgi:ubiquinol-cytochrome c reductase cytochrome b subunit
MHMFLKWLEERTGLVKSFESLLFRKIPGGAKWRYTWGGLLVFMFVVQAITGFALWMAYSPSTRTAWESVFYIQHIMPFGWLVRGIHYYAAEAMVILVLLHVLQKIWFRGYQKPRELMFWLAMAMALVVVSCSLTGYLLPWDQQGYWSAKVRTHIMSLSPVIGPYLERISVGGDHFGHFALTRFFALHAGFFPFLLVLLLVGRMLLMRRYRQMETESKPDVISEPFWPNQALKNALTSLAVMGVVLLITVKPQWFGFAHLGMGAPLASPADPTDLYAAARPEWYFLFLFQFLKYFPGELEIVGAIVIPGAIVGYFALMPWIGRHIAGHVLNILVSIFLLGGAIWLTLTAKNNDARNAGYQTAAKEAQIKAARAIELASGPKGIPAQGALQLLHQDPKTQGPQLFATHCSSCHRYDGHDGLGAIPADAPSAPDLKGFASRQWLTEFLNPDHIATERYFGGTAFADGDMVKYVTDDVAEFDADKKDALAAVVRILSAEAQLPSQKNPETTETPLSDEDRDELFYDVGCTECHEFHFEDEDMDGPDLTGYGSRGWMIEFISNPAHARFYKSNNDRMPSFREEGILDEKAIGLLADWLRGDWYEPAENQASVAIAEPAP